MKRLFLSLTLVILLSALRAPAAQASVDVNVNIGLPFPQIVLPAPPQFIMPPALGFYVAVDIPYDIFLIRGSYYLYRDNGWYRAGHYNGPWRVVEHRYLPPGLRKHSYDRIRYYRDDEFRRWDHDRRHYKGRYFRPERQWKGHSDWEKGRGKDDRKGGRGRDDYRDGRGGPGDDHGRGRGGR
jgi:hypothetical protein